MSANFALHDFALQVTFERHSRRLVTIDDEGNIWLRSLQPAMNDSLASPVCFARTRDGLR